MLTNSALLYLQGLTYDPAAERCINILPLGAIYWSDEIPDFKVLMKLPKKDSEQVYRLIDIRLRLWRSDVLSVEDQAFWNDALGRVPHCPLFQRLALSEEDRRAQLNAERSADEFIEGMAAEADEFEVNKDGSYSATYDLTKDRQPAWKRLFSWWASKSS